MSHSEQPTRTSIAGNVRAEMARRRIPLSAVVAATGIASSTLSRKVNGENDFTATELAQVSVALGVPLADLLTGIGSAA